MNAGEVLPPYAVTSGNTNSQGPGVGARQEHTGKKSAGSYTATSCDINCCLRLCAVPIARSETDAAAVEAECTLAAITPDVLRHNGIRAPSRRANTPYLAIISLFRAIAKIKPSTGLISCRTSTASVGDDDCGRR